MRQARLLAEIQRIKPMLLALSHDIHHRPELGNREFYARDRICGLFEKMGWRVEKKCGGLVTSFIARWGGGKRPAIGFLAEYDALPEIGHACGHNLIAAASVGAGLALSRVLPEASGQIAVIGTPAEETSGGKVAMQQAGVFQGLDAVMMFHPGSENVVNLTSLALEALEVSFRGEGGHFTILDSLGGDSLEALLQFFFWVSQWKKSLPVDCFAHGIIREGGSAPNIRPEKTVARFYIRTADEGALDRLVRQFTQSAGEIARRTRTKLVIARFEARYRPFLCNETLARVFVQSLKRLGISCSGRQCRSMGSMDMGNISWEIPAIHPFLTMTDSSPSNEPVLLHTEAFAQAAGSAWGDKLLITAAQALALTGLQVMTQEGLRRKIRDEHYSTAGSLIHDRSG